MDEFVFVDRSDDVIENFGPEEMKFEDDSDSEVVDVCMSHIHIKISRNRLTIFTSPRPIQIGLLPILPSFFCAELNKQPNYFFETKSVDNFSTS